MPGNGLAYHTVVNAMRDRLRTDPGARFALAIKTAINGHYPHLWYRLAARERRQAGWSEHHVSLAIVDWLHSDLNPAVQMLRLARDNEHAVAAYNLYNDSAPLSIRTELRNGAVRRSLVHVTQDDELCAAGSIAVVRWLETEARKRVHARVAPQQATAWNVALYLGVERLAGAEASRLLDQEGDLDLPALAARLGVSSRTLQRQLASEDLSVSELRQASRQTRALALMQGRRPRLSDIAVEAGFADQAHMARCLKKASGLTPRQILQTIAA